MHCRQPKGAHFIDKPSGQPFQATLSPVSYQFRMSVCIYVCTNLHSCIYYINSICTVFCHLDIMSDK